MFFLLYFCFIQKAQFADCLGTKAQECTEANFYPIGTGPFKVVDFKPNDVVVLEANDHYREAGKPAFQRVLFKGGGDAIDPRRQQTVGPAQHGVLFVNGGVIATEAGGQHSRHRRIAAEADDAARI